VTAADFRWSQNSNRSPELPLPIEDADQDHREIVTSHMIAVAADAGLRHLAPSHIDDFPLSRDQCLRPMTLVR